MSIAGILSGNLFSAGHAQNTLDLPGLKGNTPNFKQIKNEFQKLGQDLQSGNLQQAQADYAALSSNLPGASQTTTATNAAAASKTGNATVAQQLAQLGQDLQSGNLQAAQHDFTNIQQTAQQDASQQAGGIHHHHHYHGGGAESTYSSTSSQQANSISQVFGNLAADLQSGNLSGAQSAFATLQNDLQQIGGFSSTGSNSSSPTSTGTISASVGNLNVNA